MREKGRCRYCARPSMKGLVTGNTHGAIRNGPKETGATSTFPPRNFPKFLSRSKHCEPSSRRHHFPSSCSLHPSNSARRHHHPRHAQTPHVEDNIVQRQSALAAISRRIKQASMGAQLHSPENKWTEN